MKQFKTYQITQSENIQKILNERKWMNEYKEAYENLIEKYNDKSWKWIPSGYREDFLKVMKIKWKNHTSNDIDHSNTNYYKKRLRGKNGLDIFFEIEKNITNPFYFWSMVVEEYSFTDFNQATMLEWLEAFTRHDRMELTLEQRQNCVENMVECKTGVKAKQFNHKIWKTLKTNDEVIVYRGSSIPEKSNVRVGRKKLNNPNSHKQDSGIGFSYTMDKRTAEYFANMYSVKNGEMWLCQSENVSSTIPSFIDVDYINEKSQKVITKHSVNKENILFYNNQTEENEVIILPDTLELIDYQLVRPNPVKHPNYYNSMDAYMENGIGEITTMNGVETLFIDQTKLSPEQLKVMEQHKLN